MGSRTSVTAITLNRNGSLTPLFDALSVDQLINSLHSGEGDTTIFTGLEVDPGESLADTAAQSGIIDLRPFRKAEEALFYKFGLKPRVIHGKTRLRALVAKPRCWAKWRCLLVDSPESHLLTPVSLLKNKLVP